MNSIIWKSSADGQENKAIIQTPVGKLCLLSKGDVLLKTEWVDSDCTLYSPQSEFLIDLSRQIKNFWNNQQRSFEVALLGQGTLFQKKVWKQLIFIEFAKTATYSEFAKQLDTGARAIGGACRYNPYPLIIPCHRVVSVSGIGGYVGQTQGVTLKIKQNLLAYEQSMINKELVR